MCIHTVCIVNVILSATHMRKFNDCCYGGECSGQLLLRAFRSMLLIRRFEEKAAQLYTMGLIGGFCHLCIGQEAVATSLTLALTGSDLFITSYRCHGLMLALGSDPRIVMAELLGRSGGCSGGRGGSMHMFDIKKHFYGGHGIVGAQVPIGTGLAFAEKYKGTTNICATLLGDGAINQGQVYESFNMAALWGLPVMYVVENNLYALGTSLSRSTKGTMLYKRGENFGIEGKQVDGMDFVAMYNAILEAANYVRSKQMPFLLEVLTYRYRGHSMSDPAQYRKKEEVERYKARDPIKLLNERIIADGIADEKSLDEIETEVLEVVDDAAKFAQASPQPNVGTLLENVISPECMAR